MQIRERERTSADGYGPLGVVFWGRRRKRSGEDRAGPALNPLKGSSARLPSYGYYCLHARGQTQNAENTVFSFSYPG